MMAKNILKIAAAVAMSALPAFAADFPFAGEYNDAQNHHISVDVNGHVESDGASYPRPLILQSGNSYQVTAYYPRNGCEVPSQQFFDFAADGSSVDVEVHTVNSVIRGPFGCRFVGDNISRLHLTKVSGQPNGSWSRTVEAQDCGEGDTRRNLDRQFARYQQQCDAQGGQSSSQSGRAFCTEPDPNSIRCHYGWCTIKGKFNCTKP
jgi:hypothetical protein